MGLILTINKFFHNQFGAAPEQELVEDLVIEAIQISGRDLFYIPRNTNNIDNVLNEIPNSSFTQFKAIEMYLNNSIDGLAGNTLLNLGFGMTANNTAEFIVSRKRFYDVVQPIPLAGDLLYDSLSKLLYEIDYVDSEPTAIYQLQKLYTYALRCNLFTYSYETFNSGITSVDADLNSSTFVDQFAKDEEILEDASEYNENVDNPFGTDILPEDS